MGFQEKGQRPGGADGPGTSLSSMSSTEKVKRKKYEKERTSKSMNQSKCLQRRAGKHTKAKSGMGKFTRNTERFWETPIVWVRVEKKKTPGNSEKKWKEKFCPNSGFNEEQAEKASPFPIRLPSRVRELE